MFVETVITVWGELEYSACQGALEQPGYPAP